MRVAFLLSGFPLLSETFILNQVTGLIDRGVAVDVFVRSRTVEEKVHGDVSRYGLRAIDLYQDRLPDAARWPCLLRTVWVALRRRRRCPRLLPDCLRQFRYGQVRDALTRLYPVAELLDRGPYDIVHAHFGANGTWAVKLRCAGSFSARVVTTFHGALDLPASLNRGAGAYDELFQEGDLFLSISENVRERLLEIGCPESRIAVHRVGIHLRRFGAAPRPPALPAGPRITTIARLVEMKGVEYGIRAVAKLVADYPGLRYCVAGDGPLRRPLEMLIEELGIQRQVDLLGWLEQSEIQSLLDDTDILLAPSVTDAGGVREGLPTVLMEALASRVPVVATGYSGIPELVRDGVEGYLTAERNVDQIACRLRQLAANPELRREMGECGRRRVEELHDIDRLNGRLVELYRDLAGGRQR